jgi:hypothetical protein
MLDIVLSNEFSIPVPNTPLIVDAFYGLNGTGAPLFLILGFIGLGGAIKL